MSSNWTFIRPLYIEPLEEIYDKCQTTNVCFLDHMNGFDVHRRNRFLDYLDSRANADGKIIPVWTSYIPIDFSFNYKNLLIDKFDPIEYNFKHMFENVFLNYTNPPVVDFKNFLCTFNGSAHISRILLISLLRKSNLFDPKYCSQNFPIKNDLIDGTVKFFAGEDERYYRKFFLSESDPIDTFTYEYKSMDHASNIRVLESKLTESFVHLVSETMATSYCPFITEKAFYSVVTKGLFVTFGQPGWHRYFEFNLGFKLYTKIFDYSFDFIENPLKRLLALTDMLSKFRYLSKADWHDLYLMEEDTINYNYNHYCSGDFVTHSNKIFRLYKELGPNYLKENLSWQQNHLT